eukprot:COSAG05_NODE_30461_length_102_cov_8347.666667_1_plen_25_part_01
MALSAHPAPQTMTGSGANYFPPRRT